MIHGNAKKISRILRATLPNGESHGLIMACALAYAAPLPVDARGCVTTPANKFYNTNLSSVVADIVSCVNEVQILDVGTILTLAKDTFVERVNAISTPVIVPMSAAKNFGDVELTAFNAIVEVLCSEFSGS